MRASFLPQVAMARRASQIKVFTNYGFRVIMPKKGEQKLILVTDEVETVTPLCDNPHPRDLAKAAIEQYHTQSRLITRTADETLAIYRLKLESRLVGPPSMGHIWKQILGRIVRQER
jgi:hypothetical protein